MKLVKAKYEILSLLDRESILKSIEAAGRTCYKSEDKITEDSASKFVRMICKRNHLSVIEHQSMSVRFTVDRGVSHELVRHRLASFSQESTRYCNYKGEMEFIVPCWMDIEEGEGDWMDFVNFDKSLGSDVIWAQHMDESEQTYKQLIEDGWKPEQARSILPNSLKTEIVITANLREWKEIFNQRCAPAAHPQMREVMIPLQEELQTILPEIFE